MNARNWQDEFARQIDEARPILFSIANRIAGPIDAEDAVQTALMRTWREGARLRGPQCYARWATMVVRTAAIDIKRRRARHPESTLPEGNEAHLMQPDEPNDAESAVLGQLDGENAIKALGALPEVSAQVLFERDGLGLDYSEIRNRHQLSDTQLRNMLHRSRQKFKLAFSRLGVGLAAAFAALRRAPKHPAGSHAKPISASARRVLALRRAAIVAVGTAAVGGGIIVAINMPDPQPDQVPVANVIPATPSPTATLPADPTPTRAAVASQSSAPTSAPASTQPVPEPAEKAAVASAPAPTQAPASPTSPTSPTSPAKPRIQPAPSAAPLPTTGPASKPNTVAAPKLGTGADARTNTDPASAIGKVRAVPSCSTANSDGSTTTRWLITSTADLATHIATHNGQGRADTIPAHSQIDWAQTIAQGSGQNWWLTIATTDGTTVGQAHYSGPAIAALPNCG